MLRIVNNCFCDDPKYTLFSELQSIYEITKTIPIVWGSKGIDVFNKGKDLDFIEYGAAKAKWKKCWKFI